MVELEGRTAIVTGAARGIGFAVAKALCAAGAKVVISDIDLDAGENAAAALKRDGGTAEFVRCDVADEVETSRLIEQVFSRHGAIDILVNNAGILSRGQITDVSVDEWDRLFAVNVRSVFLLTRLVLPLMTAQRDGRIIHIASVAGQVGGGYFGNAAYAATKGAIIAFSKGVAREAGPANVTSNVICPGFVDTELTQSMDADVRSRALEAIPMRRPGSPDEIASSVLFLASSLGSYTNGVTLNSDGGLVRH